MKQHITVKQAKELSVELIMKQLNNDKLNLCISFEESFWNAVAESTNIGRMIEILEDLSSSKDEQYIYFETSLRRNIDYVLHKVVYISHFDNGGHPTNKEFVNIELCDALWEALKYVFTLKIAQ